MVVNTGFYVSHEEVDSIMTSIDDWSLGYLDEGEEFIGILLLDNNIRKTAFKSLGHRHALQIVGVAIVMFLGSVMIPN